MTFDINSLPDEPKSSPKQVAKGPPHSYRRFHSLGFDQSSGAMASLAYGDEGDHMEYVMIEGQSEPHYPIIPDGSGSLLHHYGRNATRLLGPDQDKSYLSGLFLVCPYHRFRMFRLSLL